jgi:hypothetical protein
VKNENKCKVNGLKLIKCLFVLYLADKVRENGSVMTMPELRTHIKFKAIPRILCRKFGKLFKIKKSPKNKGYHKFLSESEQRWLDEYTARTSQLPSRIGIPYYD